jgi:hypothetical protein
VTKVLTRQLTVVRGPQPERDPQGPPLGSPSLVERSARSAATGGGKSRDEELEQILLALNRRAPAPAVGPSHWWG